MRGDGVGHDAATTAARQAWRLRREAMEAHFPGGPWYSRYFSPIYQTARRLYRRLDGTLPARFLAQRAAIVELTELSIHFSDLPDGFDGYRILHLSDLHLDYVEEAAMAAVRRIASCNADVCVITGDIRDDYYAPLEPVMEQFARMVSGISTRDGILAVLGNHDCAAMVDHVEALGVRLLINERVSFSRGVDQLFFTGVDDVHVFHTELADAALASADERFGIALAHSPEIADEAHRHHRLYLTGHTHGGQVCLPGGRPLISGLHKEHNLARGVWQRGEMVGFTTRGVGVSGFPVRLNCVAEVALITLRSGPRRVAHNGVEAEIC